MIRREIITQIEDYLYDPEVIILYWARQVWKTSIMKYLQEKETRETLFLDLEDKDNFAVVNTTAEKFVEYLEAQRWWTGETPLVVFIDEFQYMDNPTSFLKYAHDHYPNLKLIVSWSSTLEIRKKLKDSMVWRYVKFNIYPLNFSEFLTFKWKENLSKILRKPVSLDIINEELLDFYNEYIIYWGYPRIVLESNYEKKKQLLNNNDNYYDNNMLI